MSSKSFDVKGDFSGVRLLEANAGTGKTYAIQNIFLKLVAQRGLAVRDILVVTFTNLTAAELSDRIRRNLVKALDPVDGPALLNELGLSFETEPLSRIRQALACFDEAAVSTIHGFCSRTLAEYAFEAGLGFDVEAVEEDEALNEFVLDYWRSLTYPENDLGTAAVSLPGELSFKILLKLSEKIKSTPGMMLESEGSGTPAEVATAIRSSVDALLNMKDDWERVRDVLDEACQSNSLNKPWRDVFADSCGRMARFFSSGRLDDAFALLPFSTSAVEKDSRKKPRWVIPESIAGFLACVQNIQDGLSELAGAVKRDIAGKIKGGALESAAGAASTRSFDDILLELRRALNGKGGEALKESLRERHKAVLIDEFQDTDMVQYEIFDGLFGDGSIPFFLIGDPKQSIYAFRGADVFSYQKVKEKAGQNAVSTLTRNYRSSPSLVDAVNRVFDFPGNPFVFDWMEYVPSEAGLEDTGPFLLDGKPVPPLRMTYFEFPTPGNTFGNKDVFMKMAHADTVSRIVRMLSPAGAGAASLPPEAPGASPRPLRPADIAVLVLKNDEALAIRDELGRWGVPAVVQKSDDVFRTEHAKELLRVLRAVADPRDGGAVKTALATSFFGLDPARIASFALDGKGFDEFESWLGHFDSLHKEWVKRGFMPMFAALFVRSMESTERTPAARMLGLPGGEPAVANIRQIAETLNTEALSKRLGVEGVLRSLAQLIFDERKDSKRECRLESDEDAVAVMTVYKSKGLQFPVVFCPSLWAGSMKNDSKDFAYHTEQNQTAYAADAASREKVRDKKEKESLAELARLAYVGMTRAKYYCHLAWGDFKDGENSSLGYLLGRGALEAPPWRGKAVEILGEDAVVNPDETLASTEALAPEAFIDDLHCNDAKTLFGRIDNRHGTLSFTSLAADKFNNPASETAPPSSEKVDDPEPDTQQPEAEPPGEDFFSFPRNERTGHCVHEFFELAEFSALADIAQAEEAYGEEAERLIRSYGLAGPASAAGFAGNLAARKRQLLAMASRVVTAKLPGGAKPFRLADLPPDRILKELKFQYPVGRLVQEPELNNILRRHGRPDVALRDAGNRHGLMEGAIDIVFELGGRHHILDWKTNHLGDSPADYAASAIESIMTDKGYRLQYYIYTVALHRHLRSALPGYDYNRHFGGVFYLFVRGVGWLDGDGVLFDRLDAGLVDELDYYFIGNHFRTQR